MARAKKKLPKKTPMLLGPDGSPLGGPLKPKKEHIEGAPRPKTRTDKNGDTEFPAYLDPIKNKADIPIPLLWRVIVQPVTIPRTTDGGIMIPDSVIDRAEYLRSFGRVVAIGPLAWCDDRKFGKEIAEAARAGEYPVKIGTWVLFDQYKGQIVEVNGQKFKRMNDDDIDAIVPNPEAIKFKY